MAESKAGLPGAAPAALLSLHTERRSMRDQAHSFIQRVPLQTQ